MSDVPYRMQIQCGNGLRPVDRYMMYADIDFGHHSQISTTLNLTVNEPIFLTHAKRSDQYCRA